MFYLGSINLKATDGHFLGNEVVLPLYASSEFAPAIEQMKDIVLAEGSMVTLNSSILSINDPDNLNDVTLRLIEGKSNVLIYIYFFLNLRYFSYNPQINIIYKIVVIGKGKYFLCELNKFLYYLSFAGS